MAFFALKLLSPRPTFPMDATEAELKAMAAHSAYWQKLADEKQAIAVGPIFDPSGPFGLALIEVDDQARADDISRADPVILSGLGFRYQVFPVPSLILRTP
jgi:uncharacterized protein YciI